MKHSTIVAAVAAVVSLSAVNSAEAYNWNSKSSFGAEWNTQADRITAGRKSGVLSRAAARSFFRRHNYIATLPYNASTRAILSRESKRIAAAK
jgi:opacity protein-like surface antigen